MQVESGSKGGVNLNTVSESNGFDSISMLSTSPCSTASGVNFIVHRVSKMDTLAGVAIKYGVEVADIKRMNGLVTDLQMYALKTLHIPLPGRHPPSPIVKDGSASNGEQTPNQHNNGISDSFQSLKLRPPTHRKVSAAMSTLQGYYNLTPSRNMVHTEGTEMAVYKSKTGRALFSEDDPLPKRSPASDPLLNHHKTRSLVNGFLPENGEIAEQAAVISVKESVESEKANSEKSVRRRQKADTDPFSWMPRMLFEDSGVGLSGKTGRSAALRPKIVSQTDNDISHPMISAGDSSGAHAFLAVRKSSSTSSLQDSDNGSSVWSPWNLKPDVIAKPILDGLPNPMNIWRNKAALD